MSKNYAEGICTACGTEPCAEHAPTEPVRASWQTTVQDAIRLCRKAGRGESTISAEDAYRLANIIEDATQDAEPAQNKELLLKWQNCAIWERAENIRLRKWIDDAMAYESKIPSLEDEIADTKTLLRDTAEALWDLQRAPDCWCPDNLGHDMACQQARTVSKRLKAASIHLPPDRATSG
jgi:hypothetical protein